MDNLAQRLRDAAVVRDVDLGECDPAYAGIRVPFRVNWTRRQHRERYELSIQYAEILKGFKAGEDRTSDLEANVAAWQRWWAGVFLADKEQIGELFDALSQPHWSWLTQRVLEIQAAYEEEETKKVRGRPGAGREEPLSELPSPTTER